MIDREIVERGKWDHFILLWRIQFASLYEDKYVCVFLDLAVLPNGISSFGLTQKTETKKVKTD